MGWDALGIWADEAGLAQYLNEPGALEEERWKALTWQEPEKGTVQCWWLVHLGKLNVLRICVAGFLFHVCL